MLETLPNAFVFMKVGNHAGETFEQILARKRREVVDAGCSFWGYGGTTLHPISKVQPFARLQVKESGSIYLVMEAIDSKADPDLLAATQFSRDGIIWEPIPQGITVKGSRYALVLDEITPGDLILPLNQFVVGIGASRGKPADAYLQGRVDKGCLIRDPEAPSSNMPKTKQISFAAKLKDPYAVLLR